MIRLVLATTLVGLRMTPVPFTAGPVARYP